MAAFEILPNKKIGQNHPCFIIAEIGQNHQGDISTAKQLIQIAMECGADCVKFQKSNLKSKFNKKALSRPYTSENSFGTTYGEHKKHLEFSEEEYMDLLNYAFRLNIPFTASGMDKLSIDFLHHLNVPFFKIGSGDGNNLPLIAYAASLGKPIVVSTGMQELATVCKMYNKILPLNNNLAIMQCTSTYPTPPEDVHLNVIKILERHLTINHNWKGSDHKSSLEPQEFKQLIQEVRKVERALSTTGNKIICDSEIDCYSKLGKTVVASKYLPSGTVLTEDMLDIKVAEPKGWKAENISQLIGKKLLHSIDEDESIIKENLCDGYV